MLLLKSQVLYEKCIQQTDSRKQEDHLISYIYFYKAFIFILVLFVCFAEAVHHGWCQDIFCSQVLIAFSPTFPVLHRLSSPAGESVGSGEIIAAVQPSEARANWKGQVPLRKEQSPALFTHIICIHCQKWAMANFSGVFSLESALLTWAFVFFLLFSADTSSCHLLLWNLCFSAVWPCQAFPTPPCQSRFLRWHTESCVIQFYWRWQFQAWCLRERRSAQLIFLCLGACPLTFSAHFGLMHSYNQIWQRGKILRIRSP